MKAATVRLSGTAASPGIGLGFVHLMERGKLSIPRRTISQEEIQAEVARFDQALEEARNQLRSLRRKINDEYGDEHLYLIEAQLLMLDDRTLTEDTRVIIRDQHINVEWAVQKALERFKELFDKIDDEYFRDRRSDIEYVEERLLRLLSGSREQRFLTLQPKTILVAHDLSPEDLVKVNQTNLTGLAIDAGGRTSHTAILTRSLGIPSVVGLNELSIEVRNGDRIIVDGMEGRVIVRPDSSTWEEYEKAGEKFITAQKELLKNRHFKAETKDQYEVHLKANIDLLEDLPTALENGAEGVGMLRTEHLFLGGSIPPSEEEQFSGYRKVVEAMKPREVVIRVLDLPGDGLFFPPGEGRFDHNPALGLRGIRLLLREREIFRTQLRAILRASAYGKVAVLYPMLSYVKEIREANQCLASVKEELAKEGVKFDSAIRIGAMIETPAAALNADTLAPEADFFAVGTNDLTQYTLGVDRANELVADLFEPFDRSLLFLMRNIVQAGHKAGIEVGVCGEIATDPLFVPLLVGLEFNYLSITVKSLPQVKQLIREITMEEAKHCLEEVERLADPDSIKDQLRARYSGRLSFLSP